MSKGFGDVPVRDVGKYVWNNFSLKDLPRQTGRWVESWRVKYVTPRNAGIRPVIHLVVVAMVLNYLIDYRKGHIKADRWRKHH